MAATLTTPARAAVRPAAWVHAWAVLTAVCTLPLLTLGAEVTTHRVGMVDQRGFREPWHLLALWLQGEPLAPGYVIEHGHRTFGFLVGVCVIVLTVSLWLLEPRRWVRWAGGAALVGVCVQGVLGILRIDLNALMGGTLPLVHGLFAQLVFALLMALAVVTGRAWQTPQPAADTERVVALRRWALTTAGLIYGQIILGALVRHKDLVLGARAHLLMAFGVTAALVWLAKMVYTEAEADRPLRRGMGVVLVLLAVQLGLGVESWLSKFVGTGQLLRQAEPLPVHAELVRSLHYLTGALLFSTTVALALLAHRGALTARQSAAAGEGAA
jgi:cytochrome c oxidase assembly protein subunit 15